MLRSRLGQVFAGSLSELIPFVITSIVFSYAASSAATRNNHKFNLFLGKTTTETTYKGWNKGGRRGRLLGYAEEPV
jgi:hypothetical protein